MPKSQPCISKTLCETCDEFLDLLLRRVRLLGSPCRLVSVARHKSIRVGTPSSPARSIVLSFLRVLGSSARTTFPNSSTWASGWTTFSAVLAIIFPREAAKRWAYEAAAFVSVSIVLSRLLSIVACLVAFVSSAEAFSPCLCTTTWNIAKRVGAATFELRHRSFTLAK